MPTEVGSRSLSAQLLWLALLLLISACSAKQELPAASLIDTTQSSEPPMYQIGAGDTLSIFVWRMPELTTSTVVRPDGRISVPLIEDLYVSGMTPTEASREIQERLSVFIQDPAVNVVMTGFVGPLTQQVRVVGEAAAPKAIPYQANMTLLDVMIAVGGLTKFADGNRATIVRTVDGEQKEFRVRLDDLVRDGDISANVALLPGDVLIIPESFF